MRCPHCGFHHLEPKERCLRCRQPMTGDLATPLEEQTFGSGTGESFTFSAPPAAGPPPEAERPSPPPPMEMAITSGSDEGSIIGDDSGAGSVELTIQREAGEKSEATASAPEMEHEGDATDDSVDEAEPEEKAASAGEGSEETDGLAEEIETDAAEQSAGSLAASALDEVEEVLKAAEPAPDPAEAQVVAELAEELAPAPAPPEAEASGLDAWKEAESLLRAAESADQEPGDEVTASPGEESAGQESDIDSRDLPGEATAAAMRRLMETDDEETTDNDAPVEEEAPAAVPVAITTPASPAEVSVPDESSAPVMMESSPEPEPEPETSASSTGPSYSESRLDRFFEQSADDVVSAEPADFEEDSQIEIAPRAQAESSGPHDQELPLGDPSISGERRLENPRGIRAVRVKGARRSRPAGAWLLNLRRTGAGIFDLSVWVALGFTLYKGAMLAAGGTLHGSAWQWLYLVAFPILVMSGILALVYGSLFGSLTGWTPGMMIFGLRLASPDGQKPPLARSFLRTGIFILSLVPAGAGLFLTLIGDKGALHDRLSNTRVERA